MAAEQYGTWREVAKTRCRTDHSVAALGELPPRFGARGVLLDLHLLGNRSADQTRTRFLDKRHGGLL
jgi:hypothetical protein